MTVEAMYRVGRGRSAKKMLPPKGSPTPGISLMIASIISRIKKLMRKELNVARRKGQRSCGRVAGGV